MKFSVGYKTLSGEPEFFSDIVADYKDHINEVYFTWPGEPSGRTPLNKADTEQFKWELERIKKDGVALNLLFNASCYGERALSTELQTSVISVTSTLMSFTGIDAVTTMSPMIAKTVKNRFPSVDVRASVNMRIGSVKALEYTAQFFDSYCIQREYNRNLTRLEELQGWAAANGKQLHVLANSGCLNFCSFQTFHDNVVAHEPAVNTHRNIKDMTTLCREYYSNQDNWVNMLQGSSWIRPEDIDKHATIFNGFYKLASRVHDNPRLVINAYSQKRHWGNLLNLTEPGFGPLFHPYFINNCLFPKNWFEKITGCDGNCTHCSYCHQVLKKVMVSAEYTGFMKTL